MKERLSALLCRSAWLWYLPLVLLALPVWQALTQTSAAPRADHWPVLAEPYLGYLKDGSLWNFLHSPGTDSRHHMPKLVHFMLMHWGGWNLTVESLVSVALGGASAVLALLFWRHHAAPVLTRWWCGWLCTFLILSPMQWMNWAWGIQICYTMLVAAGVAAIAVFSRCRAPRLRLVAAGALTLVAIFSFLNGWLVWMLGLGAIGALAIGESWKRGRTLLSVTAWGLMAAGAAVIYRLNWPEAKEVGAPGLVSTVMEDPGHVVAYFFRMLGAPFAELAPLYERIDRVALQNWSALVIAAAGFLLLAAAAVELWRRRAELSVLPLLPWVLLLLFGLGNAAAVTVARASMKGFGAFHSRYPSFTLWFWIGLFGLVFLCRGKFLILGRRLLLPVLVWGALVGAWQGARDGRLEARQTEMVAAAMSFRHAAVEPGLLDYSCLGRGEETIPLIDGIDAAGLLHIARVPGSLVEECRVIRTGVYLGALTAGEKQPGGVELRGWALRKDSRTGAPAVAISMQAEGQPERWLGLATRNTREVKRSARLNARTIEGRIGWIYSPLTGKETSFLRPEIPLALKRTPLPAGAVTFRAYAFEPVTGEFFPLGGETTLQLP